MLRAVHIKSTDDFGSLHGDGGNIYRFYSITMSVLNMYDICVLKVDN